MKEFVNNFESIFYKDYDAVGGNKTSLYQIDVYGFNSVTVVNNEAIYIYIQNFSFQLDGAKTYKYHGNENEIINDQTINIITVYDPSVKYGVAIIKKQFI
jgi:hypothetical protein